MIISMAGREMNVEKIRKRIEADRAGGNYQGAIFYSELYVSLTNQSFAAVYLLACVTFDFHRYRRCITILENHHLIGISIKEKGQELDEQDQKWLENDLTISERMDGLLLAIRCLQHCEEYGLAMKFIHEAEYWYKQLEAVDERLQRIAAMIQYRKGNIYEYVENRNRAKKCYLKALELDGEYFEALQKLLNQYYVTGEELDQWVKEHASDDSILVDIIKVKHPTAEDSQSIEDRMSQCPPALQSSIVLSTIQAEHLFYGDRLRESLEICQQLLIDEPYGDPIIQSIHIACLVGLERKNDLFLVAHTLIEDDPNSALAYYAIGCYHMLIDKIDEAISYFSKSLKVSKGNGCVWMAFGHAFLMDGEYSQALAAFRSASRLLIGSPLPLICIAKEMMRVNQFKESRIYIERAKACSVDPLVLNEEGVYHYQMQDYSQAHECFSDALSLLPPLYQLQPRWEPILINLGHCKRVLGDVEGAIELYERALFIHPQVASTMTAIGYAYHLLGKFDVAIEYYHNSLALRTGNIVTNDLLGLAIASYLDARPLAYLQTNADKNK